MKNDPFEIGNLVDSTYELSLEIERMVKDDPEGTRGNIDKLEQCVNGLEEFDVFKGSTSLELLRKYIGEVREKLGGGNEAEEAAV